MEGQSQHLNLANLYFDIPIILKAVPVGSGNESMSEDVVAANNNDTEETTEVESETALGEGRIIDLITGERELKDTSKEQVRQFIAQALKNQYSIPYEDMEGDFVIGSGKHRRVIDVAIFHHGKCLLSQIFGRGK